MTVNESIAALERIRKKHGGEVRVYFDCPHCRQSFTPGRVAVDAVHLTGRQDDDPSLLINSLKEPEGR